MKMLLKKGHEITLIAPSTYVTCDSETNLNGSRLKPAFTAIPRQLAQRSKLAAMLVATVGYISVFIKGLRVSKTDGPFDAIMVQYHAFHFASLTSYFLTLILRLPLVVKIHDLVPGSPARKKLELFYASVLSKMNRVSLVHASHILSLSNELTEILTKIFRLDVSKISVLPNTVDLSFSPSSEEVEELRSKLKLGEKKIVFFMASAFEDRGLDVLFRALQLIQDESVVLVVVGRCDKKYKELAQQLRVERKVVFVGGIDHKLVPTYIHAADVCVGPLISRLMWYGLIPRKALECMACGKPVIIAEGTVPKDLAINGVSAVTLKPANEAQIASAIMSLVSDSSLATKIGRGALSIVSERYSTEKLADKLHTILALSMREKNK